MDVRRACDHCKIHDEFSISDLLLHDHGLLDVEQGIGNHFRSKSRDLFKRNPAGRWGNDHSWGDVGGKEDAWKPCRSCFYRVNSLLSRWDRS